MEAQNKKELKKEPKSKISPGKSLESEYKDNDFQANNKTNSSPKSIKRNELVHPPESGNHNPLLQQVREAELDLSRKINKPPVVLSFDDKHVFFLGDFSLIIGKAKSRKTFLNSLLMAVLVGNTRIDRLQAKLADDKQTVIFFDTEQGTYHAQKAAKRTLNILSVDNASNFKAYSLRKYSPKERLQIIEYILYNTPDIGVVFIDGIRDLVTSINDEEQAMKIASKLLKWSEELNIHINCSLHMNKGDTNARGHLGTELLNKSLVTLSVTKCKNASDYSEVVVTESREKEPQPFMFGIDENELPYIIPKNQLSHIQLDMQKTGSGPETFSNAEHKQKLSEIYNDVDGLPYGKLVLAVKQKYKIGVDKAKKFISYFSKEKLITNEKKGNRTIYGLV